MPRNEEILSDDVTKAAQKSYAARDAYDDRAPKDKKDAAHFRPHWPAARTAEIRSLLSTSSAKNTAANRGIRLTLDLWKPSD